MTGSGLSQRLRRVIDALPLDSGTRVLEVGGAPGAAAREVARRVGPSGHVLVVDRSAKGVALVERTAAEEIADGRLGVRCVRVEEAQLAAGEAPFDLAFACRVGVLDGRHPAELRLAVTALRSMLVPGGPIYVDTGDPLVRLDD